MSDPTTILCLASECKGQPFMTAAKAAGARVLLLTEEKHANADWPHASIDDRFLMPDLAQRQDVLNAVSYLARSQRIHAVIPLDDYDVGTAADLREHMRLPGMNASRARFFRDKLAMRQGARDAGIRVPAFTGIFHYDDLRAFMDSVPAPWVLKPRFEAGAVGIRKLYEAEALWRALDELGDRQSFFLLEEFIPGDVYHVDSIWWDGRPQLILPSAYGQPPLSVSHEGGVFATRILGRHQHTAMALESLTEMLLNALGLTHGIGHTEFIRAKDSGDFYFLETAARVGGAHISDLIEQATGLNPWSEWARVVLAQVRGETYTLPPARQDYAGLIICLAKQEWPDLSGYADPEVVWRLHKPYHAGVIAVSPDADRIETLLAEYADRFAADFLTTGPQKTVQRTAT